MTAQYLLYGRVCGNTAGQRVMSAVMFPALTCSIQRSFWSCTVILYCCTVSCLPKLCYLLNWCCMYSPRPIQRHVALSVAITTNIQKTCAETTVSRHAKEAGKSARTKKRVVCTIQPQPHICLYDKRGHRYTRARGHT